VKHVTPREAFEYLAAHPEAVLVDCRSETEYFYVGHPVGSVHVAWQEGPDWSVNPDFARVVLREAKGRDRPIVLICRSGNRTLEAARALEADGFGTVLNVLHGFEGDLDERFHRGTRNGWRHDGLPWEQM
jgi:rhodanese-related sulfurtransferase